MNPAPGGGRWTPIVIAQTAILAATYVAFGFLGLAIDPIGHFATLSGRVAAACWSSRTT